MTLNELNNLNPDELKSVLARCCGARKWVEQMMLTRPWSTSGALFEVAEKVWNSLTALDWQEAFSHHPRIGNVKDLEAKFATTQVWASEEQKGVRGASQELIEALARENREYEKRYGYIFLVCATGKTAQEMLSLLRSRMKNSPESEIKIAAQEQSKITRIRLEKVLK